ncbi:MAG: DUF1289 domain-containing protein [Propionivibrio sp.]|jgi:hypothetical protein|uniref:DUF1289 domain-containing protein n=1 Tax=Candidatus Propionivibrio dominans TaxID=2954373 RepID=A0A9D7I749_9RHOO|nr:DUF1289 domain-containing protein [Candidatus Propionivibrio dominans]MBL0167124.1 DUF1289 domain-containing protein [Propionivibrio sp.]
MNETEDAYPCVGVCLFDPDNGYCLGCGRPPLPVSMIGQGAGSEAANEETAIPHSASVANHGLPTNNAITKNSQ